MMTELCIELSLKVLDKVNWKDSKKYARFIKQEGSNVLFLASRLCTTQNKQLIITYAENTAIDYKNDAIIWFCVCQSLGLKNSENKPDSGDYSDLILNLKKTNYDIATRLFVSQALVGDDTMQNAIVRNGLHRLFVLDGAIDICFIARSKKLKKISGYKIYFLTHIVLIASMYGQKKIDYVDEKWNKTIETLKKWVVFLHENNAPNENIEIWLELLVCLYMLQQEEFCSFSKKKTLSMLKMIHLQRDGSNAHAFYHTNILWAFYFSCCGGLPDMPNK